MQVADVDFESAGGSLIAQVARPRGDSRLMVVDRRAGAWRHATIADLPALLRAGDVLVVNNTRVFPARLLGRRVPSGGVVECLLIGRAAEAVAGCDAGSGTTEQWEALMHPGSAARAPATRRLSSRDAVRCTARSSSGGFPAASSVWTEDGSSVDEAVDAIGHIPLPPNIKRADRTEDRDRYQTVFAGRAAPWPRQPPGCI